MDGGDDDRGDVGCSAQRMKSVGEEREDDEETVEVENADWPKFLHGARR